MSRRARSAGMAFVEGETTLSARAWAAFGAGELPPQPGPLDRRRAIGVAEAYRRRSTRDRPIGAVQAVWAAAQRRQRPTQATLLRAEMLSARSRVRMAT